MAVDQILENDLIKQEQPSVKQLSDFNNDFEAYTTYLQTIDMTKIDQKPIATLTEDEAFLKAFQFLNK